MKDFVFAWCAVYPLVKFDCTDIMMLLRVLSISSRVNGVLRVEVLHCTWSTSRYSRYNGVPRTY